MLGLETALALSLSELNMDPQSVVAALSWKPARIAGVGDRHGRPVAVGETANLAIFDPDCAWVVDRDVVASKSKNTPYHGRKVRGQVRHTIFAGQLVVRDGVAQR
jgi:dihydroorotase